MCLELREAARAALGASVPGNNHEWAMLEQLPLDKVMVIRCSDPSVIFP